MQNRITKRFEKLKAEKRSGFIPFIVAGDPDLETTEKMLLEIAKRGADVIELGVPFSDPVADGVTIQASGERALRNKFGVAEILKIVGEVRNKGCQTPIILFSYFNPILQFGLEKFAENAVKNGVDGILVTDLIPEEAGEFQTILAAKNLSLIMLAAPTSSDKRLEKICEKASGFVYAVSRSGVTGARTELSNDAKKLVERLRNFTGLPIAVGFGISNSKQVADTQNYADAAVVGSAIVAEIMKLSPEPDQVPDDFIEKIGAFMESLLPEKN
ncbi:MAG: tryptophan synthase subunit alpha [Pyrinomonadaceae bacterium]